ncbi:MAG: aspartyl protease family protein [Spirochaetales bacterium]|nr:aspartyl protease family protein [Spirochaetales bacterium]
MKVQLILLLIVFQVIYLGAETTVTIQHDEKNAIIIVDNYVYFKASVSLGGRTVSGYFMLDTGAGYSIISEEFLLMLIAEDDPMYQKLMENDYASFFGVKHTIDEFKIGRSSFRNVEMAISSKSYSDRDPFLYEGIQYDVLGLIGVDILHKENFFLSFREKAFWWPSKVDTDGYQAFPLVKKRTGRELLWIDEIPFSLNGYLEENGKKMPFLLDTGFSAGFNFYPSWWEGLEIFNNTVYIFKPSAGLLGRSQGFTRFDDVEVFGVRFLKGTATCFMYAFMNFHSHIIGMEILQWFDLYYQVAGEEKTLYLKPITEEKTVDLSGTLSPFIWKKHFHKAALYTE